MPLCRPLWYKSNSTPSLFWQGHFWRSLLPTFSLLLAVRVALIWEAALPQLRVPAPQHTPNHMFTWAEQAGVIISDTTSVSKATTALIQQHTKRKLAGGSIASVRSSARFGKEAPWPITIRREQRIWQPAHRGTLVAVELLWMLHKMCTTVCLDYFSVFQETYFT